VVAGTSSQKDSLVTQGDLWPSLRACILCPPIAVATCGMQGLHQAIRAAGPFMERGDIIHEKKAARDILDALSHDRAPLVYGYKAVTRAMAEGAVKELVLSKEAVFEGDSVEDIRDRCKAAGVPCKVIGATSPDAVHFLEFGGMDFYVRILVLCLRIDFESWALARSSLNIYADCKKCCFSFGDFATNFTLSRRLSNGLYATTTQPVIPPPLNTVKT